MNRVKKTAVVALLLTLGPVLPALAQSDGYGAPPAQPGIEFELGGGANAAPRYEGSSEILLSPYPIVRLKRLTLPNGFQIGGGREGGFSVSPSFAVRGERTARDTPALTGLADVDLAVEVGVEASYEAQWLRLHANLRRGFGGHHGWTGEAGIDAVVRPEEGLKLYAGPRISYADNGYMDTYFSVPAGTPGFATFDASAGIKSWGVEAGMRFDVSEGWAVEGMAGYHRLIGDAGASPVTAVGSRDQFHVRFGVLRKFRIDF